MDCMSRVSTLLDEACEVYMKRNILSKQLYDSSHAHLPGGNTRTVLHATPYPLVFESAKKATLVSVDGDSYTDFLNEYSAGIFGHSNSRIFNTLNETLSKGWNFGGHNVYEKRFAAKVVERFGDGGIDLVRFTNSGTEANTMALAAATQITKRKKIMVFTGGYHGGTLMFPRDYSEQPDRMTANLPHDFVLAPFNNIEETQKIVNELPHDSLAAILIEPVQGSGGCRPASVEFLRFLRRTADHLGAIFIVDEVMTSRLGPKGYLASLGLKADILTLGKYVGGGMSFGAFGGRNDIMELFDPARGLLAHAGTFNNNIITMAAGITGLEIYNSSEVRRLNSLGEELKTILQQILLEEGIYKDPFGGLSQDLIEVDSLNGSTKALSPQGAMVNELPPMFISGCGSLLNVRFSGSEIGEWSGLFYHHMLQNGIYLAPRGYMSLSLELTRTDIDRFASAFRAFISKYSGLLLQ